MLRDIRCMCIAYVYFYVSCSDRVRVCGSVGLWVCGNVCCVAAVVKESVFALEC